MVEGYNNDNKSSPSPTPSPPTTKIVMTTRTPESSPLSYNANNNDDANDANANNIDGDNSRPQSNRSLSLSSIFGTNNNNNKLPSPLTPTPTVDTAIPVNVVSPPPPPFDNNNNNNNNNSNSNSEQEYHHTTTLNDIVDESERCSVVNAASHNNTFDFTGFQDGTGSVGIEASLIGSGGIGGIGGDYGHGHGSINSLDEIISACDVEGGGGGDNINGNNNDDDDCEDDDIDLFAGFISPTSYNTTTATASSSIKGRGSSIIGEGGRTIPIVAPPPILTSSASASAAATPKATGGGIGGGRDEMSISSHSHSSTTVGGLAVGPNKSMSSSSLGSCRGGGPGTPVRIFVHPQQTPPPSPIGNHSQQQQFIGPNRATNTSRAFHSINRPVEEKPLLDEIREVLAQSYLIFMLSDLRLLSGTGRIGTKYENLAVDSDHYLRVTSKQIAGVDNDNNNEKDKDNDKVCPKGLSPAVIMAILILEIRDTFAKTVDEKNNNSQEEEENNNKKKKGGSRRKGLKKGKAWAASSKRNMNIDTEQSFVSYRNDDEKKKMLGESMESMMRAYSRMISEDLVADIPNIRRRRQTMNMMGGNGNNNNANNNGIGGGGNTPYVHPDSPRWSSAVTPLSTTMAHLKMQRRGSAGPGVPTSTTSGGGGNHGASSSASAAGGVSSSSSSTTPTFKTPLRTSSLGETVLPPLPPLPNPVGYAMTTSPRFSNNTNTKNKNKKNNIFSSKSKSKKESFQSLKPVGPTLDNNPPSTTTPTTTTNNTNNTNHSRQSSIGTAGGGGGSQSMLGSVIEETDSEVGFEHYQHYGSSPTSSGGECYVDGDGDDGASISIIIEGDNDNDNDIDTSSKSRSRRRDNNSNHTHVSFPSALEIEEEEPQQQQKLEGAPTTTTTPTSSYKSILMKQSFFPTPKDNNNSKRRSTCGGGGGGGSATTTGSYVSTHDSGSINQYQNDHHSSISSTHTFGGGSNYERGPSSISTATATNRERYNQFKQKNPLNRENTKQMADRLKSRRTEAVNQWNDQVENMLPVNREAATKKEFEELTDVFFDQGETNEDITNNLGARYTRKEMVDAMRHAVETRNDGRLQFLSKLFKNGSVSQLLVQSHARVVWMNDWYPLKDLTYAISVDALQRRVMVVFRGAITASDWQSATDMKLHKIQNPVKDDFDGKKETLRVFSGLYTYLFRKRKDTGTTKYDEIANMVHKFGLQRIGPDYKLFVTGHSLGGALTHFFSFFASCEERFIKNGPVKAIAFASPYIGGHSWADSIRHQERTKRLQIVQVRNHSDAIPRLPANFRIGKRGPLWRHVGICVTLPGLSRWGQWKPMVHYWGKEKSCLASTIHLFRRNIIFHFSYLRPWTLEISHTLFELQDRLMYGELNSEPGGDFELLQSTLDQLYDTLEEHDFKTFRKTKRWGRKNDLYTKQHHKKQHNNSIKE